MNEASQDTIDTMDDITNIDEEENKIMSIWIIQLKHIICNHRGTKSQMATIEPDMLEIAIQRGKMNQPLSDTKGFYLQTL